MKDLFKKIAKKVGVAIIIVSVFAISFIFINNEMDFSSELENVEMIKKQASISNVLNSKTENNKINTKITEEKETVSENNQKKVVFPYYYGVGAKDLTPTQVSKLTKDFRANTSSFTMSVSPVDQVWYFAYPDSYPALSSIKDQNGFELISDFKMTTGNDIINEFGEKKTYRIYEYNNVTTLSEYKVTYKE